jgi:hypothetical protein
VRDGFGGEQRNRLLCPDKTDNILPRKRAEKPFIHCGLVQPRRTRLSVLENVKKSLWVDIVIPYDSGEKFEFSLFGEHK